MAHLFDPVKSDFFPSTFVSQLISVVDQDNGTFGSSVREGIKPCGFGQQTPAERTASRHADTTLPPK